MKGFSATASAIAVGRGGLVVLVALIGLAGCCSSGAPAASDDRRWQDPSPPQLDIHARARRYQDRLDTVFRTPDGVIDYRRFLDRTPDGSYGAHADGAFHTGIALAAAAMRHAVVRSPTTREHVARTLDGVSLLAAVSGKRGLLARHVTPVDAPWPAADPRWQRSVSRPRFAWRGDVSKDQYAGVLCGLGVALAVLGDDAEIRQRIGNVAGAIADHLIDHDLRIVDVDGETTTHGDLRAHVWGAPIGVNALISLAATKVAAAATGADRHVAFWRRLVEDGYPGTAYWAHFALLGVGHRVNDHMGYLALWPLLLLETDAAVRADLCSSEARSWGALQNDRNPFFAMVHALALRVRGQDDAAGDVGRQAAATLGEFPDDKVVWPVDLTRSPFDFPRALLPSRKGVPRTTEGVPLWLRPRTSSFWASDPFALVGTIGPGGLTETAGIDFLVVYWGLRHDGWLTVR